jgi:polyhydroxybutyrate depolymerase
MRKQVLKTWVIVALCSVVLPARAGTNVVGSIFFDGDVHAYTVHIPSSYAIGKYMPLVFGLHGYGWRMGAYMNVEKLWMKADSAGFLIVYPEGADSSWDSGPFCCGRSSTLKRDDVGFIRALVDTLRKNYAIDKNRIYAVGCSNGGMMSNRLGAEAADVFAAVSGIAGPLELSSTNSELHPSRPISVLDFHALNDSTIKYAGGNPTGAPAETLAVAKWAQIDGFTKGPVTTIYNSQTTVKTWTKTNSPIEVILYTTQTGGHSFPPSYVPWHDTLWNFFQRHTLLDEATPVHATPASALNSGNLIQISYLRNNWIAVVVPLHCEKMQIIRLDGTVVKTVKIGNSARCEFSLHELGTGIHLLNAIGPGLNSVYIINGGLRHE